MRQPNDCLLVALEARARLQALQCPFVEVLEIVHPEQDHFVCVFATPDGELFSYDCEGALRLPKRTPRTADSLAGQISIADGGPKCGGRFVR